MRPERAIRVLVIDDSPSNRRAITAMLESAPGIEVLDRAMCPRWHVDRVGLRLLSTWVGPATEWLNEDFADRRQLGSAAPTRATSCCSRAKHGRTTPDGA